MSLLTWTQEEFGTSIGIADQQHQVLFDMVNKLHDTVSVGGNRVAVGQQLDELVNYVVAHFKAEEDLMQANGYPNFTAHKAEHEKLLATCGEVAKKFHNREIEITPDTTIFVKDWLVNHIPNIDKHYGPFLNEKGIN